MTIAIVDPADCVTGIEGSVSGGVGPYTVTVVTLAGTVSTTLPKPSSYAVPIPPGAAGSYTYTVVDTDGREATGVGELPAEGCAIDDGATGPGALVLNSVVGPGPFPAVTLEGGSAVSGGSEATFGEPLADGAVVGPIGAIEGLPAASDPDVIARETTASDAPRGADAPAPLALASTGSSEAARWIVVAAMWILAGAMVLFFTRRRVTPRVRR